MLIISKITKLRDPQFKLWVKKGKIAECRYYLRINQIKVINSGKEKGSVYFLIEVLNEKRVQLCINTMHEKGLIY